MFRVPGGGGLVFLVAVACGPDDSAWSPDLAAKKAARTVCPPPSVYQGPGHCVIDEDEVLDEVLVVPAGVRLQCRNGATLLPSDPGSLHVPAEGSFAYTPSVPDTAIFVGGRGVTIQNCGIDGFDFGIAVIDLKAAPGEVTGDERTRIIGNDISVKTHAIFLMRTDDVLIVGNDLDTTSAAGLAVNAIRNVDRNEIVGNRFTGSPHSINGPANGPPPDELTRPWSFPGGLDGGFMALTPAGPTFTHIAGTTPFAGNGVQVGGGSTFHLFSVVVAGRLFQSTYKEDGYAVDKAEDNVIEGNTFELPGPDAQAVLLGTAPNRTSVRDNTITDAAVGVTFGSLRIQDQVVPGRCTGAPDRLCVGNDAYFCNIPGIDDPQVDHGVCQGSHLLGQWPGEERFVSTLTSDTWVEDNEISGIHLPSSSTQLSGGILERGSTGVVLRGNQISGAPSLGIRLTAAALESSLVTDNVVIGMSSALALTQTSAPDFKATFFGATVTHNDFIGSTSRAILLRGPYDLAGSDFAGNYWGHDAPPCFHAFGTPSADSPTALAYDSNPSCEPVAGLDPGGP